jgi:hypothetical protein
MNTNFERRLFMITVSTKRLMEAIEEADAFALPKMSTGTQYLYDNLYSTLASGGEVRLSGLDFNAFELDDVGEIERVYNNCLEAAEERAEGITRSLWAMSPVAAAVFV